MDTTAPVSDFESPRPEKFIYFPRRFAGAEHRQPEQVPPLQGRKPSLRAPLMKKNPAIMHL
jgi:hypothetical protein